MYGENEKFLINDETKREVKKFNPGKRILGLRTSQINPFNEKIEIEAIFKQPNLGEIQEFQSQIIQLQKQFQETGQINLKDYESWFKRMLIYPVIESKEESLLVEFLQYYPNLMIHFMVALFTYSSRPDKDSKNKSEQEIVKAFKI